MSIEILLDTDIGTDIDDAAAIVYGLKSGEFDLRAVTTVYGKVDTRAKIAKKILDCNKANKTEVYTGESIPIKPADIPPYNIGPWHNEREGECILSQEEFNAVPEKMGIKRGAVDFLVNEIMGNPGRYVLVTIGALTNLAKALQTEPRIAGKIKHYYMMAGSLSFPNLLDLENFIQTDIPERNLPTLVTITVGGNDILWSVSNKEFDNNLTQILSHLKSKYKDLLILLGTIYDPSDWVGRFVRADIKRIYQLNKILREQANDKKVVISDIHRHFLGHGLLFSWIPRNYWYCGLIEPNVKGGNEVRRVFLESFEEYQFK